MRPVSPLPRLPLLLGGYLDRPRAFADKVTVATIARETYRQVHVWNNLGLVLKGNEQPCHALVALGNAAALYLNAGGDHRYTLVCVHLDSNPRPRRRPRYFHETG
ncbi:hypothetical protein [Salinactinospora qingdaonensis]|uniref:Uncharacterized protein n=1 Tax=Salinactinospora qingdaonensis TaxID=702744 RepID=A0ABP7FQP2_9ACTN